MEENKIKILLDTDVGDDIDDALAIAMAARFPCPARVYGIA